MLLLVNFHTLFFLEGSLTILRVSSVLEVRLISSLLIELSIAWFETLVGAEVGLR